MVGQVRTQAGPCSSKLHRSHFTATARMPGTQSSSVLTFAGAGGAGGAFGVLAFAGICSGRLPENSIAPNGQAMPHSLQLTHRLSFSCTAPSTRVMALTGHTPAHGASSQWWQSCGADSFSLRMTRRRGMDCSPCRRCVSEHAASQVRQPIQTVESAITKRFTGQSSGDSHF